MLKNEKNKKQKRARSRNKGSGENNSSNIESLEITKKGNLLLYKRCIEQI